MWMNVCWWPWTMKIERTNLLIHTHTHTIDVDQLRSSYSSQGWKFSSKVWFQELSDPKFCRGYQIMNLPSLRGFHLECKSMWWMLSDLPFGFVMTCGHLACRYWKLWGRLGGLLGNLTVMQHERRETCHGTNVDFLPKSFDPLHLILNWSDLWFVSTLPGCFTWYRSLFCWIPFLSGTNEPSFHLLGCWCMSDLTTGLKEVDFCFEMSSRP